MHANSMKLMKSFVMKYLSKDMTYTVLDVGSMDVNGSYKKLFDHKIADYKGMDMKEGNNVDIVCNELYNWKEIPDGSFDVVISGQCLEHVPMPWIWIKEIRRVVKSAGVIIILAPWQWRPHYYPVDCWRILPEGMNALFEYAGFEMIDCGMSENDTYGIGIKI